MSYKDDGKLALAILKLAEAQRRLLILLDAYLVLNDGEGDEMGLIKRLVESADKDARGVDGGTLKDTEITP